MLPQDHIPKGFLKNLNKVVGEYRETVTKIFRLNYSKAWRVWLTLKTLWDLEYLAYIDQPQEGAGGSGSGQQATTQTYFKSAYFMEGER